MTTARTIIHASSNGDRWFLCHGDDTADVFVFHEPNDPSGGTSSRIDLGSFLSTNVASPERRDLLRVIGTLIDGGHTQAEIEEPAPEPGAAAAAAEPTPGENLVAP